MIKITSKIRSRKITAGLENKTRKIIDDVYKYRDSAVFRLTRKFDNCKLTAKNIIVSDSEKKSAMESLSVAQRKAIFIASKNIEKYARQQLPKEFLKNGNSAFIGQIIRPIENIGVYVPGGKYPLVSSVLMSVVPAKVAGCKKIIICTPPKQKKRIVSADEKIIAAACMLGVNEIYKVGGAQAIAAMALGTKFIPKVDKIVGPGNAFVAQAKKLLYGTVGVDMPAGPSEILIIADKSANPSFIAADMLAQAEHDKESFSILLTTSKKVAYEVRRIIEQQLKKLPDKNRQIASASLLLNGQIVLKNTINECYNDANSFAPEHLELMVNDADITQINSAGSVFIGQCSPEAAGDYATGPNHTLPTSGNAKVRGGLSVLDFLKIISIQCLSKKSLERLSDTINAFTQIEGLSAHANSVNIRLKGENDEKKS
ncbi:MAG: histidinol dehydrogenase [archaeon]